MPPDTPTSEPQRTRRGGTRPGAGAPAGNRNAARRTPREDTVNAFRAPGFAEFRRMAPPAIGELITLALARAIEDALDEAEAMTFDLTEEERDQTQRRATFLATHLVIAAFADAWQVGHRSRNQREASAIRALRPWLRGTSKNSVTPNNQTINPRI